MNKKRNAVEWAMHYRQIIILVVCCLVAFGIYSLPNMRKNEFPDFTIRQGILCGDILLMMRTPDIIFQDAYYYLLITFIGVPCTFFYNLLSSIIRALGDSKTPFWFLLFSAVLNILLDLFCILVLDWGVL